MPYLRAALDGDRQRGHPVNWVPKLAIFGRLVTGKNGEGCPSVDHLDPARLLNLATWGVSARVRFGSKAALLATNADVRLVPEADIWHEETNAWDMRILSADGQTTRTKWPLAWQSSAPLRHYRSGLEARLRWEEAGDA